MMILLADLKTRARQPKEADQLPRPNLCLSGSTAELHAPMLLDRARLLQVSDSSEMSDGREEGRGNDNNREDSLALMKAPSSTL